MVDETNVEAELDLPAPTGPIQDYSWLEVNSIEAGGNHNRKVEAMQAGARGIRNKIWHCDGDYVYFRRKMAATPAPGAPNGLNPHLVQRHDRMIAAGEYKHVATQDDVEIYELTDLSPFKRKGIDLGSVNISQVRWYAIWAVLGRWPGSKERREPDYGLFVDCLEEMSSRIKGQYHDGMAKKIYSEELEYTFRLIAQAGGPSQQMIDYGVQGVMKRRGQGTGKVILLPR